MISRRLNAPYYDFTSQKFCYKLTTFRDMTSVPINATNNATIDSFKQYYKPGNGEIDKSLQNN